MYETLLVIFFITAIVLVAMIMLQQGRGSVLGSSFGTGVSSTLFGSSGSVNFMTRMTVILAMLFFIVSLALGNINSDKTSKKREWENISMPAKIESDQSAVSTESVSDMS